MEIDLVSEEERDAEWWEGDGSSSSNEFLGVKIEC